jgi:hypothetical protein
MKNNKKGFSFAFASDRKTARAFSWTISLAAVAALMLPRAAFAWSREGHMAIGQIAQDQLKRATDDPASQTALANVKVLLNTDSEEALAYLAPCADRLRAEPAEPPEPATSTKTAARGYPAVNPGDPVQCGGLNLVVNTYSAPWHFIDIPITAQVSAESLDAYCPGGDCNVAAIKKNVQILSDLSASISDKQIALMYLVHFVGDEHQPLHCATEIVDGVDDRGGNDKSVTIDNSARLDLHALWDHMIEVRDNYPLDMVSLETMPSDASQWTQGDFVTTAAIESFEIAKDTIYPSYHKLADNSADHVAHFGSDYWAQMQAITNKRLQMGGFRLAALLKQSLGGQLLSLSAPTPASGSGASLEKASSRMISAASVPLP